MKVVVSEEILIIILFFLKKARKSQGLSGLAWVCLGFNSNQTLTFILLILWSLAKDTKNKDN